MHHDVVVGIARIAVRLGVSERTAQRWFKAKKLPGAYKLGGETSPVRIPKKRLESICRGMKR